MLTLHLAELAIESACNLSIRFTLQEALVMCAKIAGAC